MRETFKENVADELRSLRAKCNLSQREVAKIAGVDVGTIVRYENNTTSMQLDIIEKILSVYKTNASIFFKSISANMQNKSR